MNNEAELAATDGDEDAEWTAHSRATGGSGSGVLTDGILGIGGRRIVSEAVDVSGHV